jgi:biopolymer transport protein ExbD
MAGGSGGEEVDLTTLLNIMVVLVSFLMFSAMFSKTSIQELNMPPNSAGGPADPNKDQPVVIEVMLRKNGLEISNGKVISDSIPLLADGSYNTLDLSARLKKLKDQHMDKKDVILLMEPDVEYDDMIQVMDAVKFVKMRAPGRDNVTKSMTITLFPNVTVGDAPPAGDMQGGTL